jgi:hypothetical protein
MCFNKSLGVYLCCWVCSRLTGSVRLCIYSNCYLRGDHVAEMWHRLAAPFIMVMGCAARNYAAGKQRKQHDLRSVMHEHPLIRSW